MGSCFRGLGILFCIPFEFDLFFKKKLLARTYGQGSTVSRLHTHYEETVYFFITKSPRSSCYQLDRPQKDESLSRLWSHSVVLDPESLFIETSLIVIVIRHNSGETIILQLQVLINSEKTKSEQIISTSHFSLLMPVSSYDIWLGKISEYLHLSRKI